MQRSTMKSLSHLRRHMPSLLMSSSTTPYTNPLNSSSVKTANVILDNNNPATVQFDPVVVKRVEADISKMYNEIHQELDLGLYDDTILKEMAKYYFDGKGKAVRPFISMTLGHALNIHLNHTNTGCNTEIEDRQRKIAIICEMIHTASLVHDDILDHAETRRGKRSVNIRWNRKKSTICGDYILAISSKIMAQLRSEDVVIIMSKILSDLVQGEFQQLQNKSNESERFELYLLKTFNKTASLIAYSCQANAVLANAPPDLVEASYKYGRNVGIAFQLVDDLLDFVGSSHDLGKPAAADLSLGLATAPVLFACNKYPELEAMIARRFSHQGDVQAAFQKVKDSDGLDRTRQLAQSHCDDAIKSIQSLTNSPYKSVLIAMTDKILNRMK